MNSRRLGVVALRTAVFVIAAVVVGVLHDWSLYAVAAVALTLAALAVQIGGMLWLRRGERTDRST